MNHKYYRLIWRIGPAALILFFMIFRFVNMPVKDQLKVERRAPREESPPQHSPENLAGDAAGPEHALRLSDPEKFHIMVQQKGAGFANQMYWDAAMRKTLRRSDVLSRMSQGKAFEGVGTTPVQFQKRLQRIDERIREYELRVHRDSGDDYARQKLQDLYMLRSAVSNLKEAVVVSGPKRRVH